jgi:DNA polymerase-3 subunit alpha
VYSVLDGYGKIDKIVERCKKLGMKGVALTDHGNCFGWYELNKECKKQGIKPIFGNEMYIAPGSATIREKVDGEKPYYHLIVLCMNQEGYKNLMRLTSWSWIEGRYYKPRIDLTRLAQWNEGLIVTSACLGGRPSQLFLEGRLEEAEDHVIEMKRILGDRYYLELTHTGLSEDGIYLQTEANNFLVELSKKHGVKLIITADSHYVEKDEWDYHRTLVSINTGNIGSIKVNSDTDQDDSGLYYEKEQYYIKTYDDLRDHYVKYHGEEFLPVFEDAMAATDRIAEMCNVNFVDGMKIIPQIVDDPDSSLSAECEEFLVEYLYKIGVCSGSKGNEIIIDQSLYDEYMNRLSHELDVITKMEFSDYFMVVAEYTKWAKSNGIMVGGGRGSAAGSLVAFCMQITGIDPIEHDLLFERFLNRGRAKKPLIEFKEFSIDNYREVVNGSW